MDKKINIAFSGGQCTGKSVTAAALFALLKTNGLDYDLIGEEKRRLFREFGSYQSPFERLYMWRQQEREELRSTAANGFITDYPLFQFYTSAKAQVKTPRDNMAVRELYRMCLDIPDRYQLIIMAEDPQELPYKTDGARKSKRAPAVQNHLAIRAFVEHLFPDRLLLVKGPLDKRLAQIQAQLEKMGLKFVPLPYR